jgi:peptide/nickel transport system permease protein
MRHHLLPHLLPLLAVSASLNVASTIALEAGLSYLGLGVQPPTPSWGTILHDGSPIIGDQWWLSIFPGLAIVIAVFACHALGDTLREAFAMEQLPA